MSGDGGTRSQEGAGRLWWWLRNTQGGELVSTVIKAAAESEDLNIPIGLVHEAWYKMVCGPSWWCSPTAVVR